MKCQICGKGGPTVSLFRFNKPGEMPPIWRCREHMTAEQKEELADIIPIVDAIEADNNEPATD